MTTILAAPERRIMRKAVAFYFRRQTGICPFVGLATGQILRGIPCGEDGKRFTRRRPFGRFSDAEDRRAVRQISFVHGVFVGLAQDARKRHRHSQRLRRK